MNIVTYTRVSWEKQAEKDLLINKDADHKFYHRARHEILNEINKEEVYLDTIEWLDKH